MMLEEAHRKNCKLVSDINEHLPTLYDLAKQYKHITEFGVRTGLSTISLLAGADKNAKVISFDIEKTPEIDAIGQLVKADGKDWTFIKYDTGKITIDETNILFIDTLHNYGQLKKELWNNAHMVKDYIIMHDTTTFGTKGETVGAGLWYAVEEFLHNHSDWIIANRFTNNNGLTILRRIAEPQPIKEFKPLVVVYTAIYGNKDKVRFQPPQTIDVDYVCYTDNIDIECALGARDQWKIIQDTPFKHLHPRMQAKYYRTHPEILGDYKYKIRIDGRGQLLRNDSIEYFLSQFLDKSDILCFQHPERDCIYDEAKFSMYMGKYKGLPGMSQVEHYLKERGHPKHYGLTGTGLLITRGNNELIKDMFKARWEECLLRTYQDQLSFDPLVRKFGVKRQWISLPTLQQNQRTNPYIDFTGAHAHER